MPLDLAMEVWDSWPKAVGLTGFDILFPCESDLLAARDLSSRELWVARPERFTPNKLALIE